MTKPAKCVDCKTSAPEVDTSYTLISGGWRLSKRQTPQGPVVEWRCARCWRKMRLAHPPGASSGEFRAAQAVPDGDADSEKPR